MTLAPRLPAQRLVPNQRNLSNPKSLRNLKSQMQLHKMIIISAKTLITAQKQKVGIKATLVANGMRILIYMASEDPIGRGRSLKGSRHSEKVIVMGGRKLRKKGKYFREIKFFYSFFILRDNMIGD